MTTSMDVDVSETQSKTKPIEYEISVQLNMHSCPVRCVSAIDDNTIISAGKAEGEIILWKKRKNDQKSDDIPMEATDNKPKEPTDDSSAVAYQDSWDGEVIFSSYFHPLTFCLAQHKIPCNPMQMVTGGSDHQAVVWDIAGDIKQKLVGHSNSVNSVDITDDGQIVTGSYDSTAKLWNADGTCLATMDDHKHGVEVCTLASGEIVTGTFMKVHIWNSTGSMKIKTIENAHGHMIRKVRRHPLGFLTCGNDGYVNLWTNTGESIRKVLAHPENGETPSFIYSLECFPSTDTNNNAVVGGSGHWLSCGEDGTVKIFSDDGYLQQQLRHPSAVWDISILPNGDIVTACADRCVRIWSNTLERQASKAIADEYYEMLALELEAAAAKAGGSTVDESQLLPMSALDVPGKPGEFKMIKDPKRGPSVYQWDASSSTWQYIGEIMGKRKPESKLASDGRPMIDGISYDYVTHIDVNGKDSVPLGFNKDDDPKQVARHWCVVHGIDLDSIPKIVNHLQPMVDTNARKQKLEKEAIEQSKAIQLIPSFKVCGFEIQGKMKLPAMKKRIMEYNSELENANNTDSKTDMVYVANNDVNGLQALEMLFTILDDQSNWHVHEFPDACVKLIEQKLLHWPSDKILPILDLLRLLMLHQNANHKLMNSVDSKVRVSVLGHINDENCPPNQHMIASRMLSNFLAKRSRTKEERNGSAVPHELIEYIQECLSSMSSAATNAKSSVHTAYMMLAHNTVLWFVKFKIKESDLYLVIVSAIFEMLAELKISDKLLYYCLSMIGTCAWASDVAKEQIMDLFGEQLKDIIDRGMVNQTNSACQQISRDCFYLFGYK